MSLQPPRPAPPGIVNALLRQVADDSDSGTVRALEEYQSLFSGYEQAVAQIVGDLTGGSDPPAPGLAENAGVISDDTASTSGVPRIGHYRLLRELGRGGQGRVWLAEDTRLGRKVALKTLRGAQFADGASRQRFEREARVASSLDEPGICTVYEVGETDGQAWIAMRFLDGESLAALLRRVPRPPDRNAVEARVRIVERVARALHSAHEAGIVHRDLKPGNVILTKEDSPVLVDFGLARGESESLTAPSDLLGTPAYMAPERLDPDAAEAWIAADVWSLGVVLYEAVCGRRPFDGATREALISAIIDREPVSPAARHPAVSKDLSTVILTALAKNPLHRYESAAALAEDLRRVLEHEPILARPAAAWTRAMRWAQRNQPLAASLCGLGIVLVTGLAVSLCLLDQRTAALAGAEAAQREERQQRELAVIREGHTRQVADFQSKMLTGIEVGEMGRRIEESYREQVRAALGRHYVGESPNRSKRTQDEIEVELTAFDQITEGAQGVDVARQVMGEFVLGRAAKALETRFRDQPLVRARLHEDVGTTYLGLGLSVAAEPHLRAALEIRRSEPGADPATTGRSLLDLAALLQCKGDYAGAQLLYDEALAVGRQLGDDQGRPCDGRCSACFFSRTLFALGQLHLVRGDHITAESLISDSIAGVRRVHGDRSENVAACCGALAGCFAKKGDFVEAERLLREAISIRQEIHGDDAESVAGDLNNLALFLTDRKDYDAAEEIYTRLIAIAPKAYGYEDPRVATLIGNLGELHRLRGDYVRADERLRESLELWRRLHRDATQVALTLVRLASSCESRHDHTGAEQWYREALDVHRKLYAEADPRVGWTLTRLAGVLYERDQYRAAAEMFRPALSNVRNQPKALDPTDLPRILHHLADCLHETGKVEEALPLAQESVALYRESPSEETKAEHAHAVRILARVLTETGRVEEVVRVRREFVEDCRLFWPAADATLAQALMNLGELMVKNGKVVDAEPAFRESATIRERVLSPDSKDYWRVLNARSCLGGALSAQAAALIESDAAAAMSKFAEGEPLLVESARWLVQNPERVPQASRGRVGEALERTVRLYESWETAAPGRGKADRAAVWRAELEALPTPEAAEADSRPAPASRPSSRRG